MSPNSLSVSCTAARCHPRMHLNYEPSCSHTANTRHPAQVANLSSDRACFACTALACLRVFDTRSTAVPAASCRSLASASASGSRSRRSSVRVFSTLECDQHSFPQLCASCHGLAFPGFPLCSCRRCVRLCASWSAGTSRHRHACID